MSPEPAAAETLIHDSGPSSRLLSLTLAAVGGGAVLLLAALWRPDAPTPPSPPAGMKVGEHEVSLTHGAPQWNVLKLAEVTPARPTFGEPVPARVRIDEAHAARI